MQKKKPNNRQTPNSWEKDLPLYIFLFVLKKKPTWKWPFEKKKKKKEEGEGKKYESASFVQSSKTVPPSPGSGYSLARKALAGHTQVFLFLSPSCLCYLFEFNLPCREEKNLWNKKDYFPAFFPLYF